MTVPFDSRLLLKQYTPSTREKVHQTLEDFRELSDVMT